uniref:Uncharacterized protein n=1 Tax=Falco tinnunculus TaxID=100819 RepID=A0A8C4TLY9_FALTI
IPSIFQRSRSGSAGNTPPRVPASLAATKEEKNRRGRKEGNRLSPTAFTAPLSGFYNSHGGTQQLTEKGHPCRSASQPHRAPSRGRMEPEVHKHHRHPTAQAASRRNVHYSLPIPTAFHLLCSRGTPAHQSAHTLAHQLTCK